jgi:hypothetical protein
MESRDTAFVLGQRYTLAAMALTIALLSFLNLAGIEKAVLAIVLGVKALAREPHPALEQRRGLARVAIGLAIAHVVAVVTIILLNLDRLGRVVEALRGLSDLR